MLTPGFFTDAVGFALLLPPVRSGLIAWLGPKLAARAVYAGQGMHPGMRPDMQDPRRSGADDPIEADYVDLDDVDPPSGDRPKGKSGWSRPPE